MTTPKTLPAVDLSGVSVEELEGFTTEELGTEIRRRHESVLIAYSDGDIVSVLLSGNTLDLFTIIRSALKQIHDETPLSLESIIHEVTP